MEIWVDAEVMEMRTKLGVLGISLLLVAVVLSSGCIFQKNTSEIARETCIELCRSAQSAQVDLSDGPCLSDIGPWNITHWVCDVAHSPREAVDDLQENQCAAFWNGSAEFFVEVSPDCKFINSNCCY